MLRPSPPAPPPHQSQCQPRSRPWPWLAAWAGLALVGCGRAQPDSDRDFRIADDRGTAPAASSADPGDGETESEIFVTSSPGAPGPLGEEVPLESVRARLETLATGLRKPVAAVALPTDPEVFWVVEQDGRLRQVTERSLDSVPLADIGDRVAARGSEQGFLGLALHPRFGDVGFGLIYVNYTARDGSTVVEEWPAVASAAGQPGESTPSGVTGESRGPGGPRGNGGYEGDGGRAWRVDADSARELLRIEQPARNHNGGHLAFGPEGLLYIGTGDGGGANDVYGQAQDPASLLGKMLRIDVDAGRSGTATDGTVADPRLSDAPYAVPADNPFVGREGFRPEIWALGLRNPWRYDFDPITGVLLIGDVGQGDIEEVDAIAPGGGGVNFGWPIFEGSRCRAGDGSGCEVELAGPAVGPIIEYRQGAENGCSVTGGIVVRGADAGPLQDRYVFADYCSGRIWIAEPAAPDPTDRWRSAVLLDSGRAISSFARAHGGGAIVLDHAAGELLWLVPAEPRNSARDGLRHRAVREDRENRQDREVRSGGVDA